MRSWLISASALCCLAVPPSVAHAKSARCSVLATPTSTVTDAVEQLFAPNRAAGAGGEKLAEAGLPGAASFESMLIEGVTKFVINRARQEAIAFILDRVGDKVCGQEEAKALFKRTCALFAAADELHSAVVPGRSFQDAVTSDLRSVPWNLAERIEEKAAKLPDDKKQHATRLAVVLRLTDDVACGLERRQSPLPLIAEALGRRVGELGLNKEQAVAIRLLASILAQVDGEQWQRWVHEPEQFARVVLTAIRGVVAQELRDAFELAATSAQGTLPGDAILLGEALAIVREVVPDVIESGGSAASLQRLHARLAALRAKVTTAAGPVASELAESIGDITSIIEEVSALSSDLTGATQRIAAIRTKVEQLESHLVTLQARVDALASADVTWRPLATLVRDLQKVAIRLRLTKWKDRLDKAEALYARHAAPVIPHALAVHAAIRAYRSAPDPETRRRALRDVLEAGLGIVEQVVVPKLCGDDESCPTGRVAASGIKTARALLSGDYTAGVSHAIELLRDAGDLGTSPAYTELERFGALFSDIAAAESGDEIAAALESAASPAGSWRLRRKKTTYGLSARVGIAGGYEHVDGLGAGDDHGGTFGLHIPIVLDAWTSKTLPVPIGFGIQILDLGAIASVGIGTDTQIKPEAGFVEVLAPGATVAFGLGNSPFVLAATAAWTPALRKDDTTMEDAHDAWRVIASLSVDVPIFMW